jgi:hypothetical protein
MINDLVFSLKKKQNRHFDILCFKNKIFLLLKSRICSSFVKNKLDHRFTKSSVFFIQNLEKMIDKLWVVPREGLN